MVLGNSNCSGRRLMGSQLIGLIGLWNQIESNLQVANYIFIPNACIEFIPLLLSFQ